MSEQVQVYETTVYSEQVEVRIERHDQLIHMWASSKKGEKSAAVADDKQGDYLQLTGDNTTKLVTAVNDAESHNSANTH